MRQQQVNGATGMVLIALSLTALLTVLSAFLKPAQFDQPDEGTGAHIFQLSIAALVPVTLLAFAALYVLEHVYYAQQLS